MDEVCFWTNEKLDQVVAMRIDIFIIIVCHGWPCAGTEFFRAEIWRILVTDQVQNLLFKRAGGISRPEIPII